jgi:hypothetical protein
MFLKSTKYKKVIGRLEKKNFKEENNFKIFDKSHGLEQPE